MAREKKEERKKNPESKGVAGFTLGIVSIVMLLFSPLLGIIISLVGFFLCLKQQKREKTKAARTGMILNIIGFGLNVAMMIINFLWLSPYINQLYQSQLGA
jgi:hypothetical protein